MKAWSKCFLGSLHLYKTGDITTNIVMSVNMLSVQLKIKLFGKDKTQHVATENKLKEEGTAGCTSISLSGPTVSHTPFVAGFFHFLFCFFMFPCH